MPKKPTNSRVCACGETVFAPTSFVFVAIVDAQDGHFLRHWKWSAKGKTLDCVFYATSWRYAREMKTSDYLHRAVTGNQYECVDHINGNGHDNRRSNLRPATSSENGYNRRKGWQETSSQYKGIHLNRDAKWRVQIKVDRNLIHLGVFATELEAARAYNRAALLHHGEFARINRIPEQPTSPNKPWEGSLEI